MLYVSASFPALKHFILLLPLKSRAQKKLENCTQDSCKRVVIIPMVHLAKPKFYKKTKKKVSSFRQEGYTIFYERVNYPEEIDSLTKDTLRRKIRKLVGFPHGLDLTNPTVEAFPKFFKSGRYVMQSPENSGYFYEKDTHVDYRADQLLAAYEKKHGKIQLTECDFETDFKKPYRCERADNKNYAMRDIREELVVDSVLQSKADKILLLYGKLHYKGLKKRLEKVGYEKVRSFTE